MTIAPPALVTGAQRLPLPFGLFSVFTLRPGSGDRWEAGVRWEAGTCDPVAGIGAWDCFDPRQVLAYTGDPESGTWTVSYGSPPQTTDALAISITPAQLQTALESIGLEVTVTGTAGVAYTVQFLNLDTPEQLVPADSFNQGGVSVLAGGDTTGSTVGLPKTLTSNHGDEGVATQFTVYGHHTCSLIGNSLAAAADLAAAHLMSREEQRVEQAFWTGDLDNVPALQAGAAVDDVTVGAVDSIAVGLGQLEQYLATSYGNLGVIHMTRATALAAIAGDLVTSSGGRLFTVLGTPVAAGGGYPGTGPAGQPAADGTAWMFATPAVFGYRSEVFAPSDENGVILDRLQNNLYAIAERSYLLGFDPCGVAASLVYLTPAAPAP